MDPPKKMLHKLLGLFIKTLHPAHHHSNKNENNNQTTTHCIGLLLSRHQLEDGA
jgi:hypothetical protein